jgi:hypothetical protein
MHRWLRPALSALLFAWLVSPTLHAQAPHYAAIGNRADPTPAQVRQLNQETALGTPAQTQLHDGKLTLELSPNALLLIKVQP